MRFYYSRIVKVVSTIIVLTIFTSAIHAQSVFAGKMEFNPATGTYAKDATFTVKVLVDTESVNTTSADAVIQFDNTLLAVDSVADGTFYPTVLHSDNNGTLVISGIVNSVDAVVSGKGELATITFKALTAGTASVKFDCTQGQLNDSNISKSETSSQSDIDVLTCSSLVAGSYTITSNGSTTPTPTGTTATPTTAGTVTATPTSIPNTGGFNMVALIPQLMLASLFILIGAIPLLL
ncbi:MAG: cohesin domain-containing protein [Candidatus Roizmanbacteria bacterium]|nr:cohesin domain-containing protein [Candidatus Roizmanbacteria bacterium]